MKKSKFVALVLIFALFFSVVDVKPARAGWQSEVGKVLLSVVVEIVLEKVLLPKKRSTAYAEPVQLEPKQKESSSSWWWPFGGEEKKTEPEPEKSWWWPF